MPSKFFVIMGVSGCGKTTIGQQLAAHLDCPFYDADDFHPEENIAKMSSGIPLTDDDRAPWLAKLAALISQHLTNGQTGVLACSALKEIYRVQLRVDDRVRFIFLDGSFDGIWQRMATRKDHYMKAEMLHSQFDTLEPPQPGEALTIDISSDVQSIMENILASL